MPQANSLRGKKPIETIRIPGGLDPLAYGMKCEGDCMAPLILDGDTIICSPSLKPKPGMTVVFSWKNGMRGSVKRLLSDIFRGNKGNCRFLVSVEMDNPHERLFFDPAKIDKAHAVIGVVRLGKYISLNAVDARPRGPK